MSTLTRDISLCLDNEFCQNILLLETVKVFNLSIVKGILFKHGTMNIVKKMLFLLGLKSSDYNINRTKKSIYIELKDENLSYDFKDRVFTRINEKIII